MYSANQLCYYFVKKGIESGKPTTQMQLQKLVYFAHGLYLALEHKPLIKNAIYTSDFGVNIPEIHHNYILYGSSFILDFDLTKYKFKTEFDGDIKNILEITWNSMCSLDSTTLSSFVRSNNSPWKKYHISGINDIIIPNSDIEEYFKKFADILTIKQQIA